VKLKEFVENRKEPMLLSYRINAGYIPLTHWLQDPGQGGGRIIGEACHFIDFLSYLVDAPPCSISAQGLPDLGHYREENVLLQLTFPDGTIGTVSYLANGDRAFPKERVEVFTGGRAAVLDDFRSLELVHNGQRRMTRSLLRQAKGHREIWQAFVSAITSGGPAPIPYDHLIGVTQASFAAVQALRSGEKVSL
jgi:predicted dehydrogenase